MLGQACCVEFRANEQMTRYTIQAVGLVLQRCLTMALSIQKKAIRLPSSILMRRGFGFPVIGLIPPDRDRPQAEIENLPPLLRVALRRHERTPEQPELSPAEKNSFRLRDG
jgi:hypothetical protein